jgi:starvation-inducible DNA-binding protein
MAERFDQVEGANALQSELRDLLCLAVVGDHVRWVLIGEKASGLAEWLIDATPQWRSWADQVAKHLVTLGVAPDGRVRSLAMDIPLNWVPDGWLQQDEARKRLDDRLGSVAERAKYRRSQATEADMVRLFDAICSGLEAQAASLPAIRP